MRNTDLTRRLVLALLLVAGTVAAAPTREQCERDLAPRIGNAGKDVIWVPTPDALVTAMLGAAKTTAADYVVDLGSGDAKIPIVAARDFGARALGIEYEPKLVRLAQCYVEAEGLNGRVEVRQADIFATDFREATVLTLYLLPRLNMRLRPKILAMRPGTRVVSNTFQMGDWEPDQLIESALGNTRAYLWIVPARVQGRWTFRAEDGSDRFQLQLAQQFQRIQGTLLGSVRNPSVRDAQLRGAEIRFTLGGYKGGPLTFTGTVQEDGIHVTAERGGRRVGYVGRR